MRIYTQLDAVRKEIAIMKEIRHNNCIRLYEVLEDVPSNQLEYVKQVYSGLDVEYINQSDSDDDDSRTLSEKIYMVMELARYKEVMTWESSTFKFNANPVLLNEG